MTSRGTAGPAAAAAAGPEAAPPHVCVQPALVRFQDVRPGRVYRSALTARNTGTSSARMRLLGPASEMFRLRVRNPRSPVPAGLSLAATVEFRAERDEDARDRLLLHYEDEVTEVPLLAFCPSCCLHMDLLVDFGTVAANHQMISREVQLTNEGSAPGVFSIMYDGETLLSIVPHCGTVAPGSHQTIKVELRADGPRRVSEEARVALQGRDSQVLRIQAEMVEQVLELLDTSGQEKLTCLRFGPAYFGTSRVERVILRNKGPEACDWVALLQDDAPGTEMGTDLWRSTDAALLDGPRMRRADGCSVVCCVPREGRLGPDESVRLGVCFSPVEIGGCPGDEEGDAAPARRDFSLFLTFDIVGSRETRAHPRHRGAQGCHGAGRSGSAELAVTGVGLPLSLRPHPGRTFSFQQCMMGQSVGLLCVLQNASPLLPAAFSFRKTANFLSRPSRGHIPPGQEQEVALTFTPHQMGTFRVRQVVDVLGQVAHLSAGSLRLRSQAFGHVVLHLSAVCSGTAVHVRPPLCPGISPAVSRRTGAQYRSLFTVVQRSSCGDTEKKVLERKHALLFTRGLRRSPLQAAREQREEEPGCPPAAGLQSPKLRLTDLRWTKAEVAGVPPEGRLLSSRALVAMETECASQQVTEGLSAEPSTAQEVADCSLVLSPQQLYLVAVGPSTVDFGQVCVRSSSLRHLELSNSLQVHVWVQVEACCPQLRRSGPLSHVLPPLSRASLPLVFESVQPGPFRFPLPYKVNGRHSGHVLVQGDVVPVALELSASDVELCPTESGYRGVVTLHNRRNRAADFSWTPVPSERGIAFSVHPAAGSVPPQRELDCDLLWFASFSSPQEGGFDLCVREGNTARLRCVAKVGSASVRLAERHLVFDGVPLGISAVRRTVLHNTGHRDAFFQVSDPHPVLGMTVSPHDGAVPAGGQTEIEVLFTPEVVVKFDTRVEVALRNARSLELRVGGSVTPPRVAISVKSLQFHGVHCGSRRALPFSLENRSPARARLGFDLSRHREFSVELGRERERVPDGDGEPHTCSVEMEGRESVECLLVFRPEQVAAYDFLLPVSLNGLSPPSPPPSSVPKTLSASSKHIVTPRSWAVSVATPSCRVQATALRAPLDVSPSALHFELRSSQSSSPAPDPQLLELRNTSGEELAWRFESSAPPGDPGQAFGVSPDSGKLGPERSLCVAVTFSPGTLAPGVHLGGQTVSTQLCLFLHEEKVHPYRQLRLSASLLVPSVAFRPPRLLLPPAPLDTSTRGTVRLLPSGFARSPSLQIRVEKVRLKDGSELEPFSVLLPNGEAVPASGLVEPFACVVTFRSPSPVACTSLIAFVDQENNSFQLQVCAVAENCLLTLWPHLALGRSDLHEASNDGYLSGECGWSQLTDEAELGPGPSSSSSSSSSSFSSGSSTEQLSSGPVCPESWPGGAAERAGRTEAWVASAGPHGGTSDGDGMSGDTSDATGLLGLPCSPPRGSEEGLFFDAVLGATQRWFSQFGWPRGPNPVALPHSFRRAVCTVQASGSTLKKGGCSLSPAWGARTVYDMVLHLSGQLPPGVGGGHCPGGSAPERVRLLHRRHGALLDFLSDQGASFPHVRPEHLLEPQDFRLWLSLQDQRDVLVAASVKLDDEAFESLSRRVWTDVLLQTYKVFVLPRVTKDGWECHPGCEDEDHTACDDLDPPSRNIYSTWEKKLLTWLNCTFHKMRRTVWDPQLYDGDVPPPRWILNFDADLADGLVLATALAAYCPFLIRTHFRRMFSSGGGSSPEQNLHNGLVVCRALRELRLPFPIQAAEISEPNPVRLLMLCVRLYEKLPQYLPRQTVALSGRLEDAWTREVCVKNPSAKRLVYHASIVGQEAPHFSLPHGATVRVPPHGHTKVLVQLRSSSLRPREAVLLLTSRPSSHPEGATLAFTLRARVTCIHPRATVRCGAPCYELKRIQLKVSNPFPEDAEFRVVLVQSRENPLKVPLDTSVTENSSVQSIVAVSEEQRHSQMDRTLEAPESNEAFLLDPGSETAVTEFFSPTRCVWLQAGGAAHLDLHYVPFHLGKVYCCVLLLGHQVGDLVYLVEAAAELPVPGPLSAEPSPSVVSGRRGPFAWGAGTPQAPLRFRCDAASKLREVLLVPVVNEAWERALATVGQQRMSALERERRRRAGTLNCSSVRRGAATWALGAAQAQTLWPEGGAHSQAVLYTVQCSMPECFILPECISLPVCRTARVSLCGERPVESLPGSPVCPLSLHFQPRACGRYRCQLVLRSWRDVRVHHLEVVVHGDASAALLEFSTAALSSVTQKIPLNNTSTEDWRLRVRLAGRGFHGPSQVYVGAGQMLFYPVSFKPTCECVVQGSLSLLNDADDTEQTVALRGVAEGSGAQDHVLLRCPVGEVTRGLLHVPNYTRRRLTCKVVSDLSIVSGPAAVHVKPGKAVPYAFSVSPWKRGTCRGVIAFVAEQPDEDGSAAGGEEEGDLLRPYEAWFSLEVLCVPGEPLTVVPLRCTVQSSVVMEIPVSNPKPQPLQLQVNVEGVGLTGDTHMCVPPEGRSSYLVTFSPATVGRKMGSIIFQSELVGEFWYQLDLLADPPKPTAIPPCTCELGKWKLVFIPLVNGTDETFEMDVANSNPRNFRVLLGQPVTVAPHSTTQVPVQFYPSSLGADHTACVSFTCTQLGHQRFLLSGRGQVPGTMEPLCLSTSPGSHTSITVPFQNPTEHSAIAHVYLAARPPDYLPERLTDDEQSSKEPLAPAGEESQQVVSQVFGVPLQQTHGIPLAPQETLQVPVVFSPSGQQLAQAWLVVQLRRQDGCRWKCDVPEDRVREIRWVFPVHGVPESGANSSHPGVITCGARCRVEEHVEVLLTGCVPSSSAPPAVFWHIGSQGSPTPAAPALEDFLCELIFEDEEHRVQLEDSVSLSLLSQDRDPSSGIVSLAFNIAFAPDRPMRCAAALAVRCVTGGLWKFPMVLVATDPQVDDVISIEAAALHRTAGVCFRLSSQSRHPEPFTATFLPGGGREFQVFPGSGALAPVDAAGTLFTVTYTPYVRNRRRRSVLLVQTAVMQWTYQVEGILPQQGTRAKLQQDGALCRRPKNKV